MNKRIAAYELRFVISKIPRKSNYSEFESSTETQMNYARRELKFEFLGQVCASAFVLLLGYLKLKFFGSAL